MLHLKTRRGFTLTELLVVMVIMIILVTMTVYAVNFTLAAERTRAAARQVQSYLAGARDRAIYERRPVGVRFLPDANIADCSSSMVYIEQSPPLEGLANISEDSPGDWIATNTGSGPSWSDLFAKNLLRPGLQIWIANSSDVDSDGVWYTVQSISGNVIHFGPVYKPGVLSAGTRYKLKLRPVIRPDQEPVLLPAGIVIDGLRSQLPGSAMGTAPTNWSGDVMFSPRGVMIGKEAAAGLIHFYVAEAADAERLTTIGISGIPSDLPYGSPDEPIGDRVIVSLFPQTGAISSHPVNPAPEVGINTLAADPFYYAETGEVAAE